MSLHHQDASGHFQFKQSEHRQRVCNNLPCFNDGQFVWAYRSLWGYRGAGWDPAHLPEKFTKLYRKVTVAHVKSVYYPDGSGGWTFWKDYTFTFVTQYNSDCSAVQDFSAVGSLNGTVRTYTACPSPTTWTKDFDDWITETDPYGQPGNDDLPPFHGFYPAGGLDTSEVTSASEGSVTYQYQGIDTGGVFFKLITTVTMEDPLDTDTIRTIVSGMLATVPLTKGTPVSISGEHPNRTAASGTWGFPTKGAGFNHAYVLHDTPDCCSGSDVIVLNAIASDDNHCQCSLIYAEPDRPITVYRDRRQSYMPAAFYYSIPGSVGGGAGSLYSVGSYGAFIYGYSARWLLNSGTGLWELETWPDPSVFATYDCSAWGKKGLIARTTSDDWTVLQTADGTNTCLEPDATKCFRYYYPGGADTVAESSLQNVYIIENEGTIYRRIPDLTGGMSADCPSPEPTEIPCPQGDGTDVGIDPNPCA